MLRAVQRPKRILPPVPLPPTLDMDGRADGGSHPPVRVGKFNEKVLAE